MHKLSAVRLIGFVLTIIMGVLIVQYNFVPAKNAQTSGDQPPSCACTYVNYVVHMQSSIPLDRNQSSPTSEHEAIHMQHGRSFSNAFRSSRNLSNNHIINSSFIAVVDNFFNPGTIQVCNSHSITFFMRI